MHPLARGQREGRLFIDLHGGAFDQGLGQEPGHGGAQFVDEAGNDLGFAGEHCLDGKGCHRFRRHVELFGGFHAFFAQLGAVGEVGVGRPRAHTGDGDGAFVELLVQAAAKGQHEGLGGGIEREIGNGLVGGGAGDVEDIAFLPLPEIGQEQPGQSNHGEHVELHHVQVFRQRIFFEGAAQAIAGIVDEDADVVAFGAAPVIYILGRPGEGEVKGQKVGSHVVTGSDLACQLAQEVFGAGHEQDIEAAGGQLAGHRPADTFAGAGDQSIFHIGCKDKGLLSEPPDNFIAEFGV